MLRDKKKYQFLLNTNKSCFICLNKLQNGTNPGENLYMGEVYSVHNIFQYLKLNLGKITEISPKVIPLLDKTDLRVSLCGNCGKTIKNFNQYYTDLLKIKLKITSCLDIIQEGASINSVEDEAANKNPIALRHSKMTKDIREALALKCKLKSRRYKPIIKVKKIDLVRDQKESSSSNEALSPKEPLQSSSSQSVLVPVLESTPILEKVIKLEPLDKNCDISIEPEEEPSDTNSTPSKKAEILEPEVKSKLSLNPPPSKLLQSASSSQSVPLPVLESPPILEKVIKLEPLDICPDIKAEEEPPFNSVTSTKVAEIKAPEVKPEPSLTPTPDKALNNPHGPETNLSKDNKPDFNKTVRIAILNVRRRSEFYNYRCPVCPRMFKFQNSLMIHRESVHKHRASIECSLCCKRFFSKHALYNHKKIVHANSPKHKCEFCPAKFFLYHNLQTHKNLKHFELMKPTCEDCGRRFNTKYELNKHMRTDHPKFVVIMSFNCPRESCEAKFNNKTALDKHLAICSAPDVQFLS